MKSKLFHKKNTKPAPIVVDEASRLTVEGTEPVHVFQVDENGDKLQLLKSGTNFKIKINDCEEILMESKGDFNSVIEGPDKIDNTPIEVAVEQPLTQTQQIRQWIQNEENIRAQTMHELTWEEFKDLGDLDDGDEFYNQFNQDMTKYEMQAEAIRQEQNPHRGNPLSNQLDKVENERQTTNQEVQNDEGNTKRNAETTSQDNPDS